MRRYLFRDRALFASIYAVLVLSYCVLYSPVGLENDDGGFVLGLSYLWRQGHVLYQDIFYVRPPVSIMLHAIAFVWPFNLAPILFTRIVFYVQIGIYSGLTALLFGRWFMLRSATILLIACISFVFCAHNFPAMAWHTVDGIFFSVLAVFAAVQKRASMLSGVVAMLFAFAAALSKQPFYIAPAGTFVVLITQMGRMRTAVGSTLIALSLTILAIVLIVPIGQMLASSSSQTTVRDLISAGILDYLRDWSDVKAVAAALPLGAILLLLCFREPADMSDSLRKGVTLLALGASAIFAAVLVAFFVRAQRWAAPQSMADALFTVSAFVSIYKFAIMRQRNWLGVSVLHSIAWAASVSWGSTTVLLYSAPVVGTVVTLVSPTLEGVRLRRFVGICSVLVFFCIFNLAQRQLFSLERSEQRADAIVSMGTVAPALRGIYASEAEASAWRELKSLACRLPGPLAVGPNWPLVGPVLGIGTGLGADWLLNAELGPFEDKVEQRLTGIAYFLVYKNAGFQLEADGRFGSRITASVAMRWTPVDVGAQYFGVYKNPTRPAADLATETGASRDCLDSSTPSGPGR